MEFEFDDCQRGIGIPTALWLLAVLGIIGAFDTLYFHEWPLNTLLVGPLAHS